jgi:hypothetical protein
MLSFGIPYPLKQNNTTLFILCGLLLFNLIASYFFLFTRSSSDSFIVFAFAPFSLITIIVLVYYLMATLADRHRIAQGDTDRPLHYARTCRIIGVVYLVMLGLYFIVVGPLFLIVLGLYALASFLGSLHTLSDTLYFLGAS